MPIPRVGKALEWFNMISVFQLFKIVLGLVLASFFLIFMLNFSGIYTGVQTESFEFRELKNLKKTVDNVFLYDVPTKFSFREKPVQPPPPFISKSKAVKSDVPLFFKTGKDLSVYKNSLDFGFTEFEWVGAIPKMEIVFSPQEYTADIYSLIFDIAGQFSEETGFVFCDGQSKTDVKTRDAFLAIIKPFTKGAGYDLNLSLCSLEGAVIISGFGNFSEKQIVLVPGADATGLIKKGNQSLFYKDSMDIFSFIAGGQDLFDYKNREVFEELSEFAEVEHKRSVLLSRAYLDASHQNQACADAYLQAQLPLKNLEIFSKSVLDMKNYNNQQEMILFRHLLEDVKSAYGGLESC